MHFCWYRKWFSFLADAHLRNDPEILVQACVGYEMVTINESEKLNIKIGHFLKTWNISYEKMKIWSWNFSTYTSKPCTFCATTDFPSKKTFIVQSDGMMIYSLVSRIVDCVSPPLSLLCSYFHFLVPLLALASQDYSPFLVCTASHSKPSKLLPFLQLRFSVLPVIILCESVRFIFSHGF